jgi:hypothetical protein
MSTILSLADFRASRPALSPTAIRQASGDLRRVANARGECTERARYEAWNAADAKREFFDKLRGSDGRP